MRKLVKNILREYTERPEPDISKLLKFFFKMDFKVTQHVASWKEDGGLNDYVGKYTETCKIYAISIKKNFSGWDMIFFFKPFDNEYTHGNVESIEDDGKYTIETVRDTDYELREFASRLGIDPYVVISATTWGRYSDYNKIPKTFFNPNLTK